jgi:hypothetical protein
MNPLRPSWLVLLCCSAAFAWQPQAQGPGPDRTIWKGTSANYAIEWSTTNLKVTRAGNAPSIFDAAAQAKTAWSGFVRNSNGAPMEADFTYRLLSAVGPYLSLEQGVYCECGGAHPTSVKRFRAIDLERSSPGSPSPASLTSIFPEPNVFAALVGEPTVAGALGADPKPKSLAGLLGTLQDKTIKVKDCEYEFPDDLLSSFAFSDVQDGTVSVRLGLPSAAEVCRGETIQLGLTMPTPQALRAWLLDAKERRSGLLMADSPRDARSAVTSFHFSQKGNGKR